MYTDDFVLNQRTYEQDVKIVKAQIDDHLPLIDPMKEAEKKKAAEKKNTEKKTEASKPR